MRTLQDVLDKLEEWDISPDEVEISRVASKYLIEKAQELIDAEEGEEEE